LTDSSEGMLAESRRRLEGIPCRLELRVMDAQDITCPDRAFDIVLANNMLYHVPHRERAIAEACRVLREGGAFHATTASVDSLAELKGLLREYRRSTRAAQGTAAGQAPHSRFGSVIAAFSLENGAQQLREHFAEVDTRIYADVLKITDPSAIVDYFLSLDEMHEGARVLADDEVDAFRDFVAAKMAPKGEICAAKKTGMFVCR